jgi:hypothetical protein
MKKWSLLFVYALFTAITFSVVLGSGNVVHEKNGKTFGNVYTYDEGGGPMAKPTSISTPTA